MILRGNYQSWTVTQTQFGKIIGLSQQRVNQLLADGILTRDESSKNGALLLIASLRDFYSSQSGGDDTDGTANFWRERGLHEKAKRELAELKLKQLRGELYAAATVENVISEILVNFRTKIAGLPNKTAAQLENKPAIEIQRHLTAELDELLNELAANLEEWAIKDDEDENATGNEIEGGDPAEN